jgi:hypothetical protein
MVMKKSEFIVLVIILGLAAVLGLLLLTKGQDWGDDFAAYIMQAQSIVKGNEQSFIERNAFTINSTDFLLGPVAYPWGYPLVLASVYSVTGLNLIALKLPDLVFFIAFLFVLFRFYRRRLSSTESLLLVGIFAFHPQFLGFLDEILSDVPYLFFSFLALLVMDAYFTNENRAWKNIRHNLFPAVIGVVVFAVSFVRSTGLILLPTFLAIQAFEFWRVRRDSLARNRIIWDSVIFGLSFGVLWLASALIFPSGPESYLADFGSASPAVIINNSIYYFGLFGNFFDPLIYWQPAYWILLIFGCISIWAARKQELVPLVYFGFSILLLLLWPVGQGVRFIFPLLPLFVYFSFSGMKTAVLRLNAQYHKAVIALIYAFWGVLLIASLLGSVMLAYANLQNDRNLSGPFDAYSIATYQFIINNTAANDPVIFFKPRVMHLMTNRDSLAIDNCKQLHNKAGYIVIDKIVETRRQVSEEAIPQCNLQIKQVFENPAFVIYQAQK